MKESLKVLVNPERIDTKAVSSLLESAGMRARDIVKLDAAMKESVCTIVLDGEQLVGFGRMITDGVYYGSIWDVAVLPTHRELGIGSCIMQSLLKEAKKLDLYMIGLVTTVENKSFYTSVGFEFLSDVYAMKKLINN